MPFGHYDSENTSLITLNYRNINFTGSCLETVCIVKSAIQINVKWIQLKPLYYRYGLFLQMDRNLSGLKYPNLFLKDGFGTT